MKLTLDQLQTHPCFPIKAVSKSILATAYLPNIQYISKILLSKQTCVDLYEYYVKQSFRNRCQIVSANGMLTLSIPLIRNNRSSLFTKDIQIDHSSNWQQQHWRALTTAYRSSAYFEYYAPDLEPLYLLKEKFLCDFNSKLLHIIIDLLDLHIPVQYSSSYCQTNDNELDYRTTIHPKMKSIADLYFQTTQYYQVFSKPTNEFYPNCSIIDLLANEGPNSLGVLLNSFPLSTEATNESDL